jgi:hypothetical protein
MRLSMYESFSSFPPITPKQQFVSFVSGSATRWYRGYSVGIAVCYESLSDGVHNFARQAELTS